MSVLVFTAGVPEKDANKIKEAALGSLGLVDLYPSRQLVEEVWEQMVAEGLPACDEEGNPIEIEHP